jgi:CRISPR/Cas system CMR-associated protein Cmr5 small subunit
MHGALFFLVSVSSRNSKIQHTYAESDYDEKLPTTSVRPNGKTVLAHIDSKNAKRQTQAKRAHPPTCVKSLTVAQNAHT